MNMNTTLPYLTFRTPTYYRNGCRWALGILVHEMLTGDPPFQAEDPMRLYEQVRPTNLHLIPYLTLPDPSLNLLPDLTLPRLTLILPHYDAPHYDAQVLRVFEAFDSFSRTYVPTA